MPCQWSYTFLVSLFVVAFCNDRPDTSYMSLEVEGSGTIGVGRHMRSESRLSRKYLTDEGMPDVPDVPDVISDASFASSEELAELKSSLEEETKRAPTKRAVPLAPENAALDSLKQELLEEAKEQKRKLEALIYSFEHGESGSSLLDEEGRAQVAAVELLSSEHSSLERSNVDMLIIASREYRKNTGQGLANRDGKTCDAVLNKAIPILQLHQTVLGRHGVSSKAYVQDVIDKIKAELASGGSLDRFAAEDLMNLNYAVTNVPLWSGLLSGYVWTSEDQYDFASLCAHYDVSVTLELLPKTGYLEEYRGNLTGIFQTLLQGDMLVVNEDHSQRLPTHASRLWKSSSKMDEPSGAVTAVTYCFDDVTGQHPYVITAVTAAIAEIMEEVPCLSFVKVNYSRGTGHCAATPSVKITSSYPGCFAHLGMVSTRSSGSQMINLGPGCATIGMALHQLGHTLGLTHEITRADRDLYIGLSDEEQAVHQYPLSSDEERFGSLPFDFLSIMMPSSFAYADLSPSSKSSFETSPPSFAPILNHLRMIHYVMGQRMGLSEGDVLRMRDLYSCREKKPSKTPTNALMEKWGKGDGFSLESASCQDSVGSSCSPNRRSCHDPIALEEADCRNSCLLCVQAPVPVSREAEFFMAHIWLTAEAHGKKESDAPDCVDDVVTGISFLDGSPATCDQLFNLCYDTRLGSFIRESCKVTCGLCRLTITSYLNNISSSATNFQCKDKPATEEPVILVVGQPQGCKDLLPFCQKHMSVVKKCPVTCGFCTNSEKRALGWDGGDSLSYSNYDATAKTGCSRRRDLGLCASRRRRDTNDLGDPMLDEVAGVHAPIVKKKANNMATNQSKANPTSTSTTPASSSSADEAQPDFPL